MNTFVDTNVLIDVLQDDPQWADWSIDRLTDVRGRGDLVVNAIVVAELSRDYRDVDALRSALTSFDLIVEQIDEQAAFVAGQRFAAARSRRDDDRMARPLPDFFIGAHAMTGRAELLTRDARLYRRHFPELVLITPETHPNG